MYPKLFADIVRFGLIIITTIVSVLWLYSVHWLLCTLMAIPAFIIFVNIYGFLTLPFYLYTVEALEVKKELKELEKEFKNKQKTKADNQTLNDPPVEPWNTLSIRGMVKQTGQSVRLCVPSSTGLKLGQIGSKKKSKD